MGSRHMNFSWLMLMIFLKPLFMCTAAESNIFCTNNDMENGTLVVSCSCTSDDDTLIIKDMNISNGNQLLTLSNLSTHWDIGMCSEVHLSGSTLLNLTSLHMLELHNIGKIHVDVNFFRQYATNMKVLRVSHSHFPILEGSMNIKAQKIKELTFNNMTWEEQFSLTLLTEDGHTVDLISISNSKIDTLGEINLSARQVHQFLLENNTIESISTSAILHYSNKSTIKGNKIGHLTLLSIDITTDNFTLSENTIQFLDYDSLIVNNVSHVQITKNDFFHAEQNAFLWIRPQASNESSMTFSYNHFHKHERGTLQFYNTIYNSNLEIKLNSIYSATCDCSALKHLEAMTERDNVTREDFHKHRYMTYELLHQTSYCVDQNGDSRPVFTLCEQTQTKATWVPTAVSIAILSVVCVLLIIYIQRRHKCIHRNGGKLTNSQFNPFNYSVNFAYNDDSENEEYVRKPQTVFEPKDIYQKEN